MLSILTHVVVVRCSHKLIMGMNSDAFNDFIELFFLWDGMFDVDKQELGAQV